MTRCLDAREHLMRLAPMDASSDRQVTQVQGHH